MNRFYSLLLITLFATTTEAGPYKEHTVGLEAIESKIRSEEKKIRENVDKIKLTNDKKIIQGLTKEIMDIHKEMKRNIGKAEKIKRHIDFEHPEKGREILEKYKRVSKDSLKELELELGLDKLMSEAFSKVKEKYQEEKTGVTNEQKGQ